MRTLSLLLFLICVGLWQTLVMFYTVPDYIVPSPFSIFQTLYEQSLNLMQHTYVSLLEIMIGLGFGLVFALISSIVFDRFPRIQRHVMPYLITLKNMPIFVLAPLMIIWFGHGILLKGLLIGLSCYFPMTLGLTDGLRHSCDYAHDMVHNLNQAHQPSPLMFMMRIRLPLALPSFFTSARLAFLHAPMSVIACDWIGASSGLGYLMMLAYGQLDLSMLFAGLLILLFISIMLYHCVQKIESYSLRRLSLFS